MHYTVKKLATLSGVSVRTLHWYDQINLLKPSFHSASGYRYYEKEQLLLLQQILFFRELGFRLNDIQKLLSQDDFDKVKALAIHRDFLVKEIDRKNQLIMTIDRTIDHLEGRQKMSDHQLFYGANKAKQQEYENYIVQYAGLPGEKLLLESKKRSASWNAAEWEDVKEKGDAIHVALVDAINQGLAPEADEVQKIIHEHCQLQSRFYDMTKEIYIGLNDI